MLRNAISLNPETGSTRFQQDDEINDVLAHDVSYVEILQVTRGDYERIDIEPKPVPMAQVSWADALSTADRLKHVSDLALTMELNRRGSIIAGRILSEQQPISKSSITHTRKEEHGTESNLTGRTKSFN